MEDNIPADGNGRTVIRMAKAEKQQDGSRTYGKDENKKDEKTSWQSIKYMVLYISFRKQIIWKICKKKAKK